MLLQIPCVVAYRERCGWIPEPFEVSGLVGAQYGWVHGMSVTEMEIVHGAYRSANPNGTLIVDILRCFHYCIV